MASSNPDPTDAGFATPAAAAVSVAIALMATAVTSASIAQLKLAHADLRRTQADYALAGAQTEAELTLISMGGSGRLRWSPAGVAEVLAEPESPKLDLAGSAQLDDATLAKLRVTDPDRLLARLAALPATDSAGIIDADASPTWRACARSVISPFGSASKLQLAPASAPNGSSMQWRVGEVWRIRIALANGWIDDRIVRFTGDQIHPAAVLERHLARGKQEGDQCDMLFAAS